MTAGGCYLQKEKEITVFSRIVKTILLDNIWKLLRMVFVNSGVNEVAIIFHPKPGQILLCDFEPGFKEPEMIKKNRPVVVLTGSIKGRANLITVAALSHSEPTPLQPYHYKIPRQSMPMVNRFQAEDSWLKGDMIYTFGFHRFNLIQLGKKSPSGKRLYFVNRLGTEQMKQIYRCIMHGLNLSPLARFV